MRTAVIADDEPIIRMDLSEMLEGLDFQVVAQVADGFDAIESCKQYHPNLALLDIKMPVFDGLSAADTIIRESLAECVVLLTAFYDQAFWERAKEIGVAGYLIKPIDEKALRPAIEIALEQSSRYRDALANVNQLKSELHEKNLVDRAKMIVAGRDGISENAAYAQMRKLSMNRQRPIGEIAKMIIDADPERVLVAQAKELLVKRYHVNENTAFRKIKELSERNCFSMSEAARTIMKQGGLDASGGRGDR